MQNKLRAQFQNGVEQVQKLFISSICTKRSNTSLGWPVKSMDIHSSSSGQLAKQPDQRERLGTVLYTALDATHLGGLLAPVMPEKMKLASTTLGWGLPQHELQPGLLHSSTALPNPNPSFLKSRYPKYNRKHQPQRRFAPGSAATPLNIDEFNKVN